MSKLRTVKERKEEAEVTHDLRGLGNEAFFRNSHPYACLSVKDTSARAIHAVSEKYGLAPVESKAARGVTHLTFARRDPGQHKVQALTLFFASLEIHKATPDARMHLSESQPLHTELGAAIKNPGSSASSPEELSVGKVEFKHALSLESSIARHLVQSGVNGVSLETQSFRGADMRRITHELMRESTGSIASTRKLKVG